MWMWMWMSYTLFIVIILKGFDNKLQLSSITNRFDNIINILDNDYFTILKQMISGIFDSRSLILIMKVAVGYLTRLLWLRVYSWISTLFPLFEWLEYSINLISNLESLIRSPYKSLNSVQSFNVYRKKLGSDKILGRVAKKYLVKTSVLIPMNQWIQKFVDNYKRQNLNIGIKHIESFHISSGFTDRKYLYVAWDKGDSKDNHMMKLLE